MATSRRTMHPLWIPLAALALAVLPQFAAAQGAPGVTVDVDKCLGLEKRDERLACFDAQVEAAKRAAPAQGSSAAATPRAPTAAASAPAASVPTAAAPAAAAGATAATSTAAAPSSAPAAVTPSSADTGRRGVRPLDPDVF